MPKFEVIHYYEYTRRFEIEAADEEEASARSHDDLWETGVESDCHNLSDTIVREMEKEE